MAQRRKRRASRAKKKNQDFPGWLWMLFGLAIGLSVALAVYMRDQPVADQVVATKPAAAAATVDNNGETATPETKQEAEEPRFTFYELLPNFVMETPVKEAVRAPDVEPEAVVEPGVYVLQAGAFSTDRDADRRRAELALHGIESIIQRVRINEKNIYRVYVGPTEDLDQLNMLRSRLRAAKIDVFRIRLSD